MNFLSKDALGIAGIILGIIGFGQYFLSILQNKTKPHVFTWIIWSIAVMSVFFAQFFNGGGIGSWSTGVSGLTMIAISLLCFYKKYKLDIKKVDFVFLFLSVFAIFFWRFTSNALYAVIILTIVDLLGYFPTIRKAFYKPYEENMFPFVFSTLRNISSMLSVDTYSLITILFQVAVSIANIITIIIVLVRRRHYG
jgi:hypothetical protein